MKIQFAGFWKRFGAWFIDSLIIWCVSYILNIVFRQSLISGIGTIGIVWLYYALMESSEKQATLGKMVLHIKVTDYKGKRISFGRATGRYFSKILSGLILCVGYFMAGWTEKKQALHDMIANTYVVTDTNKKVKK
jgi:uncharacterized RDD family membrane protein YckC